MDTGDERQQLVAGNYKVWPTPSDGSCLFCAIGLGLALNAAKFTPKLEKTKIYGQSLGHAELKTLQMFKGSASFVLPKDFFGGR